MIITGFNNNVQPLGGPFAAHDDLRPGLRGAGRGLSGRLGGHHPVRLRDGDRGRSGAGPHRGLRGHHRADRDHNLNTGSTRADGSFTYLVAEAGSSRAWLRTPGAGRNRGHDHRLQPADDRRRDTEVKFGTQTASRDLGLVHGSITVTAPTSNRGAADLHRRESGRHAADRRHGRRDRDRPRDDLHGHGRAGVPVPAALRACPPTPDSVVEPSPPPRGGRLFFDRGCSRRPKPASAISSAGSIWIPARACSSRWPRSTASSAGSDDALSALQKGLLAHPGYVAAQVALGRVYLEANQTTDAIATFTKVLVADPGNLVAAKSLADIYLARGDKLEAVKKYKLYRALSGDRKVDAMIAELETQVAPKPVVLRASRRRSSRCRRRRASRRPTRAAGRSMPASRCRRSGRSDGPVRHHVAGVRAGEDSGKEQPWTSRSWCRPATWSSRREHRDVAGLRVRRHAAVPPPAEASRCRRRRPSPSEARRRRRPRSRRRRFFADPVRAPQMRGGAGAGSGAGRAPRRPLLRAGPLRRSPADLRRPRHAGIPSTRTSSGCGATPRRASCPPARRRAPAPDPGLERRLARIRVLKSWLAQVQAG